MALSEKPRFIFSEYAPTLVFFLWLPILFANIGGIKLFWNIVVVKDWYIRFGSYVLQCIRHWWRQKHMESYVAPCTSPPLATCVQSLLLKTQMCECGFAVRSFAYDDGRGMEPMDRKERRGEANHIKFIGLIFALRCFSLSSLLETLESTGQSRRENREQPPSGRRFPELGC